MFFLGGEGGWLHHRFLTSEMEMTVPHRPGVSVKWDATENECSINSINYTINKL